MWHFADLFDYKNDPESVVIDFSASHVWDHSAVTAIAKATLKYEKAGKRAAIVGLNEESRKLVEQVGLAAASGH
ncbi:sodium-independent anion transporter [Paenibacillus sp. GYB003]|uniref:sodium-independent anion transporter n=1 Tax=Paenibacillus sp. GYB003 TaxID=2994392 RepID=UPI002F962429